MQLHYSASGHRATLLAACPQPWSHDRSRGQLIGLKHFARHLLTHVTVCNSTVMRIGPYRHFFYSADGGEPMHVHIERDDRIAKWWLGPARLAGSGGFMPRELREIERIVQDNEPVLMDAWLDYLGN